MENVCNLVPTTLTKLQTNLVEVHRLVGPSLSPVVLYSVLVELTIPCFSVDCPEHSLLINKFSDKVKSGPLLYSFTHMESNVVGLFRVFFCLHSTAQHGGGATILATPRFQDGD